MRVKNKKVRKLRAYRDKLLMRVTNLEGTIRYYRETLLMVRKCIQQENYLRAYALASDEREANEVNELKDFAPVNELVKELALLYRFFATERKFTQDILVAADQRDYLRVAALCADHIVESRAHDRMLSEWSQDHGFTKSLKEETENEMVI